MLTTLKRFVNALNKDSSLESYKRDYRKNLTLPPYLNQVLIGLLLSDGSLEKTGPTSTVRLSVMFGSLHSSYLLHLFNLFEPYTDSSVRTIDVYNKRTQTHHTQVGFKTVSLPQFLVYHRMFYKLNENTNKFTKVIPDNIEELITPVVLAHLIMGDGNLKPKDNILRIYTNSFTKQDVERLAEAITNKLGIATRVVHDRNEQYMLVISKDQLETVRSIIVPYMHMSMLYKLGLDLKESNGSYFKMENHLDEI